MSFLNILNTGTEGSGDGIPVKDLGNIRRHRPDPWKQYFRGSIELFPAAAEDLHYLHFPFPVGKDMAVGFPFPDLKPGSCGGDHGSQFRFRPMAVQHGKTGKSREQSVLRTLFQKDQIAIPEKNSGMLTDRTGFFRRNHGIA